MKKLMTATIILLPLLLLAIMLVSGAIISMSSHVYVESVEFVNNDTLVLVMSDEENPPTEQLAVNVFPLKAENRDVVFSVDNKNIASVDENGIVTAKFYGETYISVLSSENKAASARRKLIVTDTSVHSIVINEGYAADMYEDETQQLSVTIYPQEATNQSITWNSSDENILSVSADGTVTSKGAGKATITAISSDNGEVQASVEITGHTKITDIDVDQTLVVTSLTESKFPQVTPVPADADVTLTFKTDNTDIATVDADGNIHFKKEGHVTVTVTATDFGNRTVEKKKEYTSTDGYYLPPLFAQKEYTVDYDEYKSADKALPIPFAKTLDGSYRKFISATYSVDNVLSFVEATKEFRFSGPMPNGTRSLRVTVKARIYDATNGMLTDYEDGFTLNVLRNAKKVAISYGGTKDVAAITTSKNTFKFTLEAEQNGAAVANISVEPANHTNGIEYALTDGQDTAQISDAGVLTFTKAGSVTVKISFIAADGSVTAEKEIIVTYAPFDATEKRIDINDDTDNQKILLAMEDETNRQDGILYFAVPAGATVTPVVTDGEEVIKLENKNGAWHIVPQMGGFATVTVSVIPDETSSQVSGKTYTVDVYVDCPVEIGLLEILLGGRRCDGDTYGASSENIAYSLNIDDKRGFMEGKTLYLRYGSANEAANDGNRSFSGNIAFGAALSSLNVTFGVKYGERAKQFGAQDHSLDGAVRSVTILRNASDVDTYYKGTLVTHIQILRKELTFITGESDDASVVTVKAMPENHQNTLFYVLENDNGIATLDGSKLTFTGEGSVTVKIELRDVNNTVTIEKEITVTYAAAKAGEKAIEVSDSNVSQKVVLEMLGSDNKDTGRISFIEPADTTVTYTIENGEDVISLDVQHIITPLRGGFATVKITVTPQADGEKKEYTVNVYVNRPVETKDFSVQFNDTSCTDKFGTTRTSVPFTVTFTGADGAMEGKVLYVKYGETEKASGQPGETTFTETIDFGANLGTLAVTFGVKYYEATWNDFALEDGLLHSDDMLSTSVRTLLRDAESVTVLYEGVQTTKIILKQNTLNFGTQTDVTVLPSNHQNTLAYVLENGDGTATLAGNKLTFQKAGSVKVKLELRGVDNAVTVQKEIAVIYAPLGNNEKEINVSDSSQTQKVLISKGETQDTGVIYYTEPEGAEVEYTVTQGNDVVKTEQVNGLWQIIPQKGGFATVKISVTPNARSGDVQEYSVKVYVDCPVSAEDFAVAFNGLSCADTFRTSNDSVTYSVTVTDKKGSMAGKKLYVTFNGTKSEAELNVLTHTGAITFAGKDSVMVTFGVEYTTEAAEFGAENGLISVSRTVTTSNGILDEAPTVTYNGGTLQAERTALTFANIGEQIILTVSKPLSPADFDLSAHKPSIYGTVYVGVSISADGSQITLTARKVCQEQHMLLSIGGKTFTLNVTVRALAEKLTVTCGETSMTNGSYETLLDSLTFNVKIADRTDGQPISNAGIQYSLNGSEWNDVEGGNVEIQVSLLTDNTLLFRSADEGASMEFRLEKVLLEDFSLEFSVQTSSSGKTVLGKVESVAAESAVSYSVPSDMQGSLTITITPDHDDLLGGFGTNYEFEQLIPVTFTEMGWNKDYDAARGVIIVSGDFSGVYSRNLSISGGSHTLTVNLSHFYLASVEFTGFDSKKPEDNYKGYQQVRVFAKQSYYGGKTVDYFRIPLVALSDLIQKTPVDPTLLTWKLTRYTGNEAKETVASQTENKVIYNGAEYTIAQSGTEYVLKDAAGSIVSGQGGKNTKNITWVDVFSEKEAGIARIYFGNFGGLSESDVQNDFFGNFGERVGWQKKMPEGANKYDGSNRTFQPSANAYSFLRVEAGDGVVGGKNCHFNFNVLADTALVNVFDVAGYSANRSIVLHHDLYGPGERSDAEEKYVMNSAGTVDSSDVSDIGGDKKIFGNGYQVNYQAFNQYLIDIKTNVGTITVGNTYNAVILGANPDDERTIDQDHLKVRLNKNQGDDTYLYYCLVKDFRQSFRLNGANKVGYIKNCVFRNASKEALNINGAGAKLYVENVVMDSVKVALLTSQNNTYYLKGSIDILNYIGKTEAIKTFAGEDIPDSVINLFANAFEKKIDTIEQYMEFFGKEGGKNELDDSKYVNLCVVNKGDKSFKDANTLYHYFWDEKSQKYVQEQADAAATNSGALRTVITSKSQNLLVYEVPGFSGMTYDSLNTVDGGKVETRQESSGWFGGKKNVDYIVRDMSKLFTNDRYIRLLCQYKTEGVKNTDHILWHIQTVYRDISLIEGRESDHIKHLKSTLKDVTWPDGTKANDYMGGEAAALYKMLSQAIVPGKNPYAD